MHNNKLYFIATMLLNMSIVEQPLKATLFNNNSILDGSLTSNLPYVAGACLASNFLNRQESLVEKQAPYAYQWYQAMAAKYPQAHLDQKEFIQKPDFDYFFFKISDWASKAAWISSSQHIYFDSSELKIINILYKKIIDGYALDDKEKTMLACSEFTLLHEAGHIEHHDAQNSATAIAALAATLKGIEYIIPETASPSEEEKKDKNILLGHEVSNLPFSIPTMLTTVQGAAFATVIFNLIRHQETQADLFACSLAETDTLQRALTLFENDGADLLYDLENKTLTPYVQTNSGLEKVIQTVINPLEYAYGFTFQQIGLAIKSTALTRWIWDTYKNPIQQGPSVRAQILKDELARRKEQTK